MSIYSLRGLGSLPAMPSNLGTPMGGQLQPNHQWVRYYENDYNHQLRQCPKNPPFGCWMIGGYAWGQREWYPPEFQPDGWVVKPLPKPFPTPVAAPKPLPPAVMVQPKPKPVAKPAPKPVAQAPTKKVPSLPKPSPAPVVIVPPPAPTLSTPSVVTPSADTVPAPQPDTTRHVGGVVGIGLIIATVLTLLRKYPQAVKR